MPGIKLISYFFKLLLFWLLFFLFQQVLFFAINNGFSQVSMTEFLRATFYGLRMHLAGIMFIVSLPILALVAYTWGLSAKQSEQFIKWETILLLIFCTILCTIDIGLYKAWGTKFNAKALAYLTFPKDVLPLIFERQTLILLPIIVIQVYVFNRLRKKICTPFPLQLTSVFHKIGITLFLIGFFIIAMRGGTQKIPLNRNQVFVSESSLLNLSSMNSFWNFCDLFFHPLETTKNPYPFFESKTAEAYFQKFNTTPKDSTEYIFKIAKPNVVLVFLESWTADVVECLGGEKSVAPRLGKLAEEGILFTNFYSTGYRTEQGLLAMLSAFPAQPQSSVIYNWGTFDKLPNLFRTMNNNGYYTSFYYGGRLQFDNVEAYLRSAGVKEIVGENDFTIRQRTMWGAYDEEIFKLHLSKIPTMKPPFFSMLGTITTHEWWDAAVPKIFNGKDEIGDKFRNTVHYSDSCLYHYIQKAKQQTWYDSTVFILVADHGCRYPLQRNNYEVERHHIPLVIVGGALKEEYRNKINAKFASHTDLATTLLAQLNISSNEFIRSKNIFNPNSPAFAYYAFDNGFGLISKDRKVIYDHYKRKLILGNESDTAIFQFVNYGKAYLQCTNGFTAAQQLK